MAPELRPYQATALDTIRAEFNTGARRVLAIAPTGSGKTIVAAEIVRRVLARGQQALFIAPRRELILQTARKFREVGIERVGIIMAGEAPDAGAPIQVASIDTLRARLDALALPEFALVFIDEAHLYATDAREVLLGQLGTALHLGLTATPARLDGRGLHRLFDSLVEITTPAELTAAGYLAPARCFAPTMPDLERVRTRCGDFAEDDLDKAMNTRELVGDVVEHWLRLAGNRLTLVFGVGIEHCEALRDEFLARGVPADHVNCHADTLARARAFAAFRAGETRVLTNVFLASYGLDIPEIGCIVLARPTQSLTLHLQMLGRGLRPCEDKRDLLVLDHAGNLLRLGLPTDPQEWSLEDRPRRGRKRQEANELRRCSECRAVLPVKRRRCDQCGHEIPCAIEVVTHGGELEELTASTTGNEYRDDPERRFHAELSGIAQRRGYKSGWVAHKFRARHGRYPPRTWALDAPLPASADTREFVSQQNREYWESQGFDR